jgi:hypothetical protein
MELLIKLLIWHKLCQLISIQFRFLSLRNLAAKFEYKKNKPNLRAW